MKSDNEFIVVFMAIWLIFYCIGTADILSTVTDDKIELDPMEITHQEYWVDGDGYIHSNITMERVPERDPDD